MIEERKTHGVGPHPKPWPTGLQYDAALLENGDDRNVLDQYRYWSVDAIKLDLDKSRQQLEIAVENVTRDFNMGTIIRNANAFNISAVHIIGRKQWNKRGAMATDLYMNVRYHSSTDSFLTEMRQRSKVVLAIDIVKNSQPLSKSNLPKNSVMLFGTEGPGLSEDILRSADEIIHIEQFGSTRSVNVGVASGIAMYAWMQQHSLAR